MKVSENDWSTVYFLNRSVENQTTEHAAESGQIVVLVHGIRTHAAWQEMVAKVLRERKANVIPIRYGYFDVFRFLCPVLTRRGPIARVLRELRDIHSDNPSSNICVIAHSFGTYAVAKILADNTDVRLSRLILCGSIVPTSYRWDRVKAQVSAEVINDCGTDDIWPVLATTATYGYGASGTVGLGQIECGTDFTSMVTADFFNANSWRGFGCHISCLARSLIPSGRRIGRAYPGASHCSWHFERALRCPLLLRTCGLLVLHSSVANGKQWQPVVACPPRRVPGMRVPVSVESSHRQPADSAEAYEWPWYSPYLWQKTRKALREALAERPKAKCGGRGPAVYHQVRQLLRPLPDAAASRQGNSQAAQGHRPLPCWPELRGSAAHLLERGGKQLAKADVDLCMGHRSDRRDPEIELILGSAPRPNDMSANYRENRPKGALARRLKRVARTVYDYAFTRRGRKEIDKPRRFSEWRCRGRGNFGSGFASRRSWKFANSSSETRQRGRWPPGSAATLTARKSPLSIQPRTLLSL